MTPGQKKYSPPRVVTADRSGAEEERWIAGDGHLGHAVLVVTTDERVLVVGEPERVAVVEPLGLDELELAGNARLKRHEDDSTIGSVIGSPLG